MGKKRGEGRYEKKGRRILQVWKTTLMGKGRKELGEIGNCPRFIPGLLVFKFRNENAELRWKTKEGSKMDREMAKNESIPLIHYHLTIFHLIYGIIFGIAFMQGVKAGVFGMIISLVVGAGAVWAAHFGGFILNVWLPKRLGIYEITRYREETEEALSARENILRNIYGSIIIFVSLLLFILCSFCSFYLAKLLIKVLLG